MLCVISSPGAVIDPVGFVVRSSPILAMSAQPATAQINSTMAAKPKNQARALRASLSLDSVRREVVIIGITKARHIAGAIVQGSAGGPGNSDITNHVSEIFVVFGALLVLQAVVRVLLRLDCVEAESGGRIEAGSEDVQFRAVGCGNGLLSVVAEELANAAFAVIEAVVQVRVEVDSIGTVSYTHLTLPTSDLV